MASLLENLYSKYASGNAPAGQRRRLDDADHAAFLRRQADAKAAADAAAQPASYPPQYVPADMPYTHYNTSYAPDSNPVGDMYKAVSPAFQNLLDGSGNNPDTLANFHAYAAQNTAMAPLTNAVDSAPVGNQANQDFTEARNREMGFDQNRANMLGYAQVHPMQAQGAPVVDVPTSAAEAPASPAMSVQDVMEARRKAAGVTSDTRREGAFPEPDPIPAAANDGQIQPGDNRSAATMDGIGSLARDASAHGAALDGDAPFRPNTIVPGAPPKVGIDTMIANNLRPYMPSLPTMKQFLSPSPDTTYAGQEPPEPTFGNADLGLNSPATIGTSPQVVPVQPTVRPDAMPLLHPGQNLGALPGPTAPVQGPNLPAKQPVAPAVPGGAVAAPDSGGQNGQQPQYNTQAAINSPPGMGVGMTADDIIQQKKLIDSIYPERQIDTSAQDRADKYAEGELQRAQLQAQLAFFGGITSSAGGAWEGVGKGFSDAAKQYGEGFQRYATALQNKATRANERQDQAYGDKVARTDAAVKLYGQNQQLKEKYADNLRAQYKDTQEGIDKFYTTLIGTMKPEGGMPMTPELQKQIDATSKEWQDSKSNGFIIRLHDVPKDK